MFTTSIGNNFNEFLKPNSFQFKFSKCLFPDFLPFMLNVFSTFFKSTITYCIFFKFNLFNSQGYLHSLDSLKLTSKSNFSVYPPSV